jgi:DNA-binding XRE family transcriptional regulator
MNISQLAKAINVSTDTVRYYEKQGLLSAPERRANGYRLSERHIKAEFARGGPLKVLLLRFVQALITQMTQTAVCNRHHGIEQQLCRLLLLCLDRIDSDSLTMTQDLIANMLGVRREGVTDAAGKLQRVALSATRAAISPYWTVVAWRIASASAIPWSNLKQTGCCPTLSQVTRTRS